MCPHRSPAIPRHHLHAGGNGRRYGVGPPGVPGRAGVAADPGVNPVLRGWAGRAGRAFRRCVKIYRKGAVAARRRGAIYTAG